MTDENESFNMNQTRLYVYAICAYPVRKCSAWEWVGFTTRDSVLLQPMCDVMLTRVRGEATCEARSGP